MAWHKGWFPRRVWLIGVALQGMLVAGGFAALQTGEIDEEPVEEVVPEAALEAHEEAAEVFVWASGVVFLLMLGAAVMRNEKAARALAGTAAVCTLAVFALGYSTGQKGGALVYQHGAANAFVGPDTPDTAPSAATMTTIDRGRAPTNILHGFEET